MSPRATVVVREAPVEQCLALIKTRLEANTAWGNDGFDLLRAAGMQVSIAYPATAQLEVQSWLRKTGDRNSLWWANVASFVGGLWDGETPELDLARVLVDRVLDGAGFPPVALNTHAPALARQSLRTALERVEFPDPLSAARLASALSALGS